MKRKIKNKATAKARLPRRYRSSRRRQGFFVMTRALARDGNKPSSWRDIAEWQTISGLFSPTKHTDIIASADIRQHFKVLDSVVEKWRARVQEERAFVRGMGEHIVGIDEETGWDVIDPSPLGPSGDMHKADL